MKKFFTLSFLITSLYSYGQYEGRMIEVTVEFRGSQGNGSHEAGSSVGGGGNSNGGQTISSTSSKIGTIKAPLKLGDKTFVVSEKAKADFKDLLERYNDGTTVGSNLLVFASITKLWDLLQSIPEAILAFVNTKDFANELSMTLSASSKWNNGIKTLVLSEARYNLTQAAIQNRRQDAMMWRHFIDMIMFPEKYKPENLNINMENHSIEFKQEPDLSLNTVTALDYSLTFYDLADLQILCGLLLTDTISGNYIAYSDMYIKLGDKLNFKTTEITKHDMILLNKALIKASPTQKSFLNYIFTGHMNSNKNTYKFWKELRNYLTKESYWSSYHTVDEDLLWVEMKFK